MSILALKDVFFSYGKTPAIQNLSLSVEAGEWVTIVGPNGSGKSTLTKLIIGLLGANSGEIRVNDLTLSESTVQQVREKIGIIFQNPDNQFVGVTVKDDIAFGLENLSVPYPEMIERIDTYAKAVAMYEYLDKEPSQLSGGQKQRVAIAGTLAMHPDIIIFDEATSMLDPEGRHAMMAIMEDLKQQGKTILSITHDLREALRCDRVVVMHEGTILKSGEPSVILRDEALLKKARLTLLEPFKYMNELSSQKRLTDRWEAILWESALTL